MTAEHAADVIARLNAALEGRYRVERELGAGGMASVYLAEDLKHERRVALKVLKPELAAVIGAERFLAEIKTTANLQHPHILPLFDSGEADSFLYYVMPFIDGETLRDRIEREGQLGVEEAVRIARDVADALDYAHRNDVIHRDIKPANILLHDGRPVVADFGIAVAISAAGGGRMTETGLSLGTPHYMSPEQASADRDLSARSDVYSLGCVLYEMLAGQPPHTGPSAQSVLVRILTEDPRSLTELRRTVPPNVAAVVMKSIEKLPADRFDSASEFKAALEDESFSYTVAARARPATSAAPIGEPTAAQPPRRTKPLAIAGAVIVALASGLLVGRALVPPATSPVTRFEVPTVEGTSYVSSCCGPQQALSPDGEWLVYRAAGRGMVDGLLFRRRLSQLGSEPIPGTEGASEPFFSPDGRSLGFFADGRLRRLPMGGGPPVTIAEVDRIAGASWGDNDVIVYSTNGQSQLFTVPANGGTPSPVPNTGPGEQGAYHPAMLPGGTAAVAALAGLGNPEDRLVGVIDLESGAVDTLATATRITFASGHLIMSGADGTVLAQPFDPGARETTGPAVAILDGVGGSGPNIMGAFAVSDAGSIAYRRQTSTGSESLVVLGAEGNQRIPLSQPGNLEGVSFSNDARRIAMQILDSGIWIWDRDQLTHELLVPNGRSAVWTPDGERIAFTRADDGSILEWMPSDGSGSSEVLYDPEFPVNPSSFSPDGKVLVFRSGIGDERNIGFLEVETGEIRWFVEDDAGETQPIVSPDGRWVAYTSDRSGRREVYVRAFDGTGGRTQISAGGGHSPRWHPEGDGIYYVQSDASGTTLASIEAGEVVRVLERSAGFDGITDLNPQAEVNWDISPDGSEYVFIGTSMETTGAPEFVWVLNWPELVRGMAGNR